MSRLFGTAGDKILFAPGALAPNDAGPITIAVAWRPTNIHAGGIIRAANAGDLVAWSINQFSDGNLYVTAGGGFKSTPYVAGGWLLTAITKAAGIAQVRAHKYDYGTAAWTHTDIGDLTDTLNVPVASVRVGSFSDGEFTRGEFTALGVWGSVLSDAALEGMTTALAAWDALAPSALWAFNQASTADPVTDLTGGGADQTSVTGTTVSAAEPPGWSYALGGADPAVGAPPIVTTTSRAGRIVTGSPAGRITTSSQRGRM